MPSNWQSKFRNEVTSASFHLTISSRMIRALVMVMDYDMGKSRWVSESDPEFTHFIPAVRCLISRGLVEHHEKPEGWQTWPAAKQNELSSTHRYYTITEAGKCVWQMLILAELITPRQEAANAA